MALLLFITGYDRFMNETDWFKRAGDLSITIQDFIDGRYIERSGALFEGNCIQKKSPRDDSLLYQLKAGTKEDVEIAVSSARRSYDGGEWSKLSVSHRKAVLNKLADLIDTNREELALYECLDVGKPISQALAGDIPLASSFLRNCAEAADKLFSPSGRDGGTMAYQLRKSVGVVAAIIAWNYPLFSAVLKAGPALVMGNSLVLKPSECSSLSAARLAELAVEAGLPLGVFNVVHGAGETVGNALALHPQVDLLSFTGSSMTGKKMMKAAGESNMKRLLLECGGKSPFIVFDDCPDDLDVIAAVIVHQAFANQGENCKAGSRLLIQNGVKDKLLAKVVELAGQIKPQDPLNPEANFGALISRSHMKKVLAYIEKGQQEGAELILGGKRAKIDIAGSEGEGYYVEPTIFDKVKPEQTIAQEEIFGPVLSVLSFEDESEAIEIANNSILGLQAFVVTQSLARTQRLGMCLNVGNMWVLGSSDPEEGIVTIGGEPHRQSGFGCEVGLEGLMSYTVSTVVEVQA